MSVDKTKLIEEIDHHVAIIRKATADDLRESRRYKRHAKKFSAPSFYFEGMMAFLRGRISSNKLALQHFKWVKQSLNTMEELR